MPTTRFTPSARSHGDTFIDMISTRPENEEEWCHVFPDGYVDLESYDDYFATEADALVALEARGWKIAGYDHV